MNLKNIILSKRRQMQNNLHILHDFIYKKSEEKRRVCVCVCVSCVCVCVCIWCVILEIKALIVYEHGQGGV